MGSSVRDPRSQSGARGEGTWFTRVLPCGILCAPRGSSVEGGASCRRDDDERVARVGAPARRASGLWATCVVRGGTRTARTALAT